jgi:Ca-activated chloride channel family protein
VSKRPGDAVGLVVFSTGGYLVSPATIDHGSLSQYLLMMGPQTLVNEGYTAIGEGLGAANRYFEQQRTRLGRPAKGQVIILLTDGENNTGRDPLIEIERARAEGTRIYVIGVALQPGAAQGIASAVPQTGGKYYDVRNSGHLEQALTDINEIEKGVFYTLSLAANEPAYFVFVFFSLGCLALRFVLHAFPWFVEIS